VEVKVGGEKASSVRDQEREVLAETESQLAYAVRLQGSDWESNTLRMIFLKFLFFNSHVVGCSPASLLSPSRSFEPVPPNALSLFIKARALAPPLSNPVMNLILLRMEAAIVQSLWEAWSSRLEVSSLLVVLTL
jgi:hypothetical protein